MDRESDGIILLFTTCVCGFFSANPSKFAFDKKIHIIRAPRPQKFSKSTISFISLFCKYIINNRIVVPPETERVTVPYAVKSYFTYTFLLFPKSHSEAV